MYPSAIVAICYEKTDRDVINGELKREMLQLRVGE